MIGNTGLKMVKKKMASGPLTNKEKEFINKNQDKGADYIAKKLSRRVEAIERFLNPEVKAESTTKKSPAPAKKNPESFLMNSLLAKRPGYNVVVMTEAASSYMDTRKQSRKKKQETNFIHKFRDDGNNN